MRLGILALCAALLPGFAGCSSSSDEEPTCQAGPSRAFVLTSLTFTREQPRGTAPGFDLDHHVTKVPEDPSCGKVDLVSPTGEQGIDNQLSLLIPEVEKRVGNAIDGIIQGAINDGRLLIMFDLKNVNDSNDDKCVDLEVKLGQGKPSLGTDGVMEAWQTFDLRKEGQLLSYGSGGNINKRVFSIGPFPLRIPIAVFDVSFTIFVRDAIIRFTMDDDGNVDGMLGGGVSIDEVAEGVKNGAGLSELIPQIKLLGRASADMGYDTEEGTCSLVSAALAFKARPAFIRP